MRGTDQRPSSPRITPVFRESASLGAVIIWTTFLSTATLILRPDRLFTADFLFGDHGVNLLVADTILTGGKLYEDVAYPYGWMPAYLYAGAAGLFGNGAG
ncbi:MAG: hypothetical protein NZM31_10820, partial [Gemmatales bacterium]|nr:hypothetical protein [Gemmatales bacterium]MDW8387489.1 hypothetical protein [Gemmatales bacterium]